MRKCEKCGSIDLKMQVPLLVNMNAKYEDKITKKSISEKDTEIIAASWDRMIVSCNYCGNILVNALKEHIKKCIKCEYMLIRKE